MGPFIHIRSSSFPILPGEEAEIVNEGMYGKALSQYLQTQLRERGYDVPFYCAEDWGWWVELKGAPFTFGVCIYASWDEGQPLDYVCTDGVHSRRKWSWQRFRFVDTTPWVERLHRDMVAIFQVDPAVEVVGISDDFPL